MTRDKALLFLAARAEYFYALAEAQEANIKSGHVEESAISRMLVSNTRELADTYSDVVAVLKTEEESEDEEVPRTDPA